MSSIPITDAREMTVAERLRLTVDLCESGLDIQRERLRRDHPSASVAEIDRRLVAWLQERPGGGERRCGRALGAGPFSKPVNPLWPSLRRIVADLSAADVRFALVGGLAASSRTEPQFTRDIDLAVAVDDDQRAEALVRHLIALGYRATTVVEQEATGRLSTVRLLPPSGDGAVVDLLFASCGIEPEIVAAAESTALAPALSVPVARVGHLIAMKLLSESPRRPQDRIDLVRLCECIAPEDLVVAEAAVTLITARGFARGRDLTAALAELRDDVA